jgi:hypothetical protein
MRFCAHLECNSPNIYWSDDCCRERRNICIMSTFPGCLTSFEIILINQQVFLWGVITRIVGLILVIFYIGDPCTDLPNDPNFHKIGATEEALYITAEIRFENLEPILLMERTRHECLVTSTFSNFLFNMITTYNMPYCKSLKIEKHLSQTTQKSSLWIRLCFACSVLLKSMLVPLNCGRPTFRRLLELCVKFFFGIRLCSLCRTWCIHCDLNFTI